MENAEKIECPDCGAALERPDEDGELTCHCGAVLISEEQEYAELMQAEELSRKWYYSRHNQRYGPVPWNRLKRFAGSSRLGPEDLIWSRGMENWQKVRHFPELIDCMPEEQRRSAEGGIPLDSSVTGGETGIADVNDSVFTDSESGSGESGGDTPASFMIQVSSGLLTALGFFQIFGIAVAAYAFFARRLSAPHATWLTAAFILGAVLCLGFSQLLRLLCAGYRDLQDIKKKLARFTAEEEG